MDHLRRRFRKRLLLPAPFARAPTEAEADPGGSHTKNPPPNINTPTTSTAEVRVDPPAYTEYRKDESRETAKNPPPGITTPDTSTAEARDGLPASTKPMKFEPRETARARLKEELDRETHDELEKADLRASLLRALGNPADAGFFHDRIRELCHSCHDCLLTESLIFKYDDAPRFSDSQHISDAQQRLGEQLVAMANAFDCPDQVTVAGAAAAERLRLKTDMVALAVHTVGRVRMAVWRDLLEEMPATMTLAYCLLATVNKAAEYILGRFTLGRTPSAEKVVHVIMHPPPYIGNSRYRAEC